MFSIKHPLKYVRENNRLHKVKRSEKVKKFGQALLEAWKDFCSTSSFVGFRYVYQKSRTVFDILFWMVVIVGAMLWSILFITDFLDRYHSLSTKTIVRSQHVPISRLPFPSITACPSGRISKSRVNKFIDNYILSNKNLKETVNITRFANFFLNLDSPMVDLTDASIVFSEYNLTLRDMLNMTTANCEEIFTVCRWAGKITPCAKIFHKILAVGGFCCGFNFGALTQKLFEKSPGIPLHYRQLFRSKFFGLNGGLSFAFKTTDEDYYFKSSYSKTLRVIIHAPYSFPVFNRNDIITSTSMETLVEINNIYNTADTKVRNLPIEDRDCIFAFEKDLKYFGTYSNNNCLAECRINHVFDQCGCIAAFFPGNGSDVCEVEKIPCSVRTRYIDMQKCNCPDDCAILKIYFQIHSWELLANSTYTVSEFYDKVTKDQGIVHITVGKATTIRLNRKLSFDEIQLASNIGGIIALCLGCSFISVIEVVYFLVIRTKKLYKRK